MRVSQSVPISLDKLLAGQAHPLHSLVVDASTL